MKNVDHSSDDDPESAPGGARSVLALIRDVQSDKVSGENLSAMDRRLCVEHLTSEGYSLAEIAQILKSTDRTISRDRAIIRRSNTIEAGPDTTSQIVGQLLKEADTAVSRIRRASRGSDVEPGVKVEAEKACWIITRDMVNCLQKLGYLPTAPQMIHGRLTHEFQGLDDVPGYDEMRMELERMESICHQDAATSDPASMAMVQQITQVKNTVVKLSLTEQVQNLSATIAHARVTDSEGDGGGADDAG